MTAQFPFFTYPEIACYRAEASYKGWWGTKSTEEYYYEAIDARCARFEAKDKDIETYKNFPGIKWSTPSDTVTSKTVKGSAFQDYLGIVSSYLGGDEDNYKRIILQEWLNFFYQGLDCWTMLRRTQVLEFKPHWQAEIATAYVDDYWAYPPNRFAYPSTEIARNTQAIQFAVDNLLLDNTLKDPQDQIPFRLLFCKDYAGLQNVIVNGSVVSFPNRARNRQQ
jgi:hypothetical protein